MSIMLFALLLAAPVPVQLAEGGRAVATIVLPAEAPEPLQAAAAMIQHVVQKRCGVELPLREDGARVDGVGLYLGETAASQPDDLPPADAHPESFALRVRDGSLFFTARYPTPVSFAVYTWLEDSLGARWFAPGELWEVIPTGPAGELAAPTTPGVTVPATTPRIWSGHGWVESWGDWQKRNKTVSGEVIQRRQFQNNLFKVFPPSKYAATHPEYYPLIRGERWIPPADDYRYWRPCESNPEVLRLTVEAARAWFDADPNHDSFSLGMDDISHLCSCDNCRALDPHPDSYEKRQFSDRHYKFVNAVAREVAKTHPDRFIGTLIYNIARKLPETVDKLEPNVFGFITENSSRWWVPGRQDEDHALTRAWRERVSHLSRYDYLGLGSFAPRYYPHALSEQIKFDKSLGLEGMYTEVYSWLPVNAPMLWAFAKLEWQPDADIDQLLNEYFTSLFGDAAGDVAAVYDILEKSYATDRPNHQPWEHRRITAMAAAMDIASLDAAETRLSAALAKTPAGPVQQRLDILLNGLRYGGYLVRTQEASTALASLAVTDAATARQSLAALADFSAMATAREAFWASCQDRDDILGETIRGLGGMYRYKPTDHISDLEGGSLAAALRLLAWSSEHDPALLEAARAQLAANPNARFAGLAAGFSKVHTGALPNLLKNPGFDTEGDWTTWTRLPEAELTWQPAGGRTGGGLQIHGANAAVFQQSVRCEPGKEYLVQAWTRGQGSYLGIRFQTAGGAWVEPRVGEVKQRSGGDLADWQPIAALITVPDGAGRLVVMLGADGQAADATAWFDDAAVWALD